MTPILLFNEADAIFGIRKSGAENAVDKMENSIQNIILQEMEDFQGIMMATTNLTQNIGGVKTRRDRVPVEKIANFKEKDYRPGGCTPLYDAMGQTLNRLEGLVTAEDKVMATIITDGYENASEEYSGKAVKSLVARLRDKGWVFAYIGANQDAVEVAKDLNISNALNYDATPEGMVLMRFCFSKANRKMSDLVACCAERSEFDKLFDEDDK